jgi:tRNA 2-selenouridine synthase
MQSPPSTQQNPWTVPSATIHQALDVERTQLVDLRSPAEFADDHLPGAHNAPFFDDLERALVGTLYRRRSPDLAFEEGRRILRERLAPLVAELAQLRGRPAPEGDITDHLERLTTGGLDAVNQALESRPVAELPTDSLVVHCWRGGLRSSSLVVLLRALGWRDVFVLEGGYKGYRSRVLEELSTWQAPPTYVLRGRTGVGKTLVLRELERLRPGLTLDLEGLAGHRSSILGMVGLDPCSQKVFDSRLAARLRAGFEGPLVVEGESRKVGDSTLPPRVWEGMQHGTNLHLVAPVERRVSVLIEDYLAHEENRKPLREQLPFIEQRLGPRKWAGELVRLLDEHREKELVETLLELYYDPLYAHSEKGREYAARLDTSDVESVSREILALIDGG